MKSRDKAFLAMSMFMAAEIARTGVFRLEGTGGFFIFVVWICLGLF